MTYRGHVRKLGEITDLELKLYSIEGSDRSTEDQHKPSFDIIFTHVMLAVYDVFVAHLPSCNRGSRRFNCKAASFAHHYLQSTTLFPVQSSLESEAVFPNT